MTTQAGTRAAAEEREAGFHDKASADARQRANEFAREEAQRPGARSGPPPMLTGDSDHERSPRVGQDREE